MLFLYFENTLFFWYCGWNTERCLILKTKRKFGTKDPDLNILWGAGIEENDFENQGLEWIRIKILRVPGALSYISLYKNPLVLASYSFWLMFRKIAPFFFYTFPSLLLTLSCLNIYIYLLSTEATQFRSQESCDVWDWTHWLHPLNDKEK